MPVRVQLRRTRGYRKPPEAISCARPARWGNPFHITAQRHRTMCVALFRNSLQGIWDPAVVEGLSEACLIATFVTHEQWLAKFGHQPKAAAIRELRGRDLACYCGLDEECHVDVLLETANA